MMNVIKKIAKIVNVRIAKIVNVKIANNLKAVNSAKFAKRILSEK
jgi:hypothetical protein